MKRNPSNSNRVLLIFARAPEPGKVKTRLALHLDEAKVLDLYRGFVEKTIHTAKRAGFSPCVCYCPEDKGPAMKSWLGPDLTYSAQKGHDLGERMADAFSRMFDQGIEKAVLCGTDIPEVTSFHFSEAFKLLDTHDCVLGPALDGGYWLIGFTRNGFHDSMFRDIAWGTGSVYATTLKRASDLDLSTASLPKLRDIDTIDDYQAFIKKC